MSTRKRPESVCISFSAMSWMKPQSTMLRPKSGSMMDVKASRTSPRSFSVGFLLSGDDFSGAAWTAAICLPCQRLRPKVLCVLVLPTRSARMGDPWHVRLQHAHWPDCVGMSALSLPQRIFPFRDAGSFREGTHCAGAGEPNLNCHFLRRLLRPRVLPLPLAASDLGLGCQPKGCHWSETSNQPNGLARRRVVSPAASAGAVVAGAGALRPPPAAFLALAWSLGR
mmetsp:Transcript_13829/g.34845  ORF Transcript_13829/g.34845 Transcript_13829/m.34845 type:complete len:225 (+) Transcript_13829:1509-2183(+)